MRMIRKYDDNSPSPYLDEEMVDYWSAQRFEQELLNRGKLHAPTLNRYFPQYFGRETPAFDEPNLRY